MTETFLYVQNLEERITYTFSVRAQTLDYGPPAVGNVTTGPQPGSPNRPLDLQLTKTWSAVRLSWSNGISGKGPIQGYYIESRQKGEKKLYAGQQSLQTIGYLANFRRTPALQTDKCMKIGTDILGQLVNILEGRNFGALSIGVLGDYKLFKCRVLAGLISTFHEQLALISTS